MTAASSIPQLRDAGKETLRRQSARQERSAYRLRVAAVAFGFLGTGCVWQGSPPDEHICDESEQISFSAFGDLEGEWEIDEEKVSGSIRLDKLSIDAAGHLQGAPFGCQKFSHPLVLDDYNAWPKEPAFSGRSRLVSVRVEKDLARLDYIWEVEGEEDKKVFFEISRISKEEIRVETSLPSWEDDVRLWRVQESAPDSGEKSE